MPRRRRSGRSSGSRSAFGAGRRAGRRRNAGAASEAGRPFARPRSAGEAELARSWSEMSDSEKLKFVQDMKSEVLVRFLSDKPTIERVELLKGMRLKAEEELRKSREGDASEERRQKAKRKAESARASAERLAGIINRDAPPIPPKPNTGRLPGGGRDRRPPDIEAIAHPPLDDDEMPPPPGSPPSGGEGIERGGFEQTTERRVMTEKQQEELAEEVLREAIAAFEGGDDVEEKKAILNDKDVNKQLKELVLGVIVKESAHDGGGMQTKVRRQAKDILVGAFELNGNAVNKDNVLSKLDEMERDRDSTPAAAAAAAAAGRPDSVGAVPPAGPPPPLSRSSSTSSLASLSDSPVPPSDSPLSAGRSSVGSDSSAFSSVTPAAAAAASPAAAPGRDAPASPPPPSAELLGLPPAGPPPSRSRSSSVDSGASPLPPAHSPDAVALAAAAAEAPPLPSGRTSEIDKMQAQVSALLAEARRLQALIEGEGAQQERPPVPEAGTPAPFPGVGQVDSSFARMMLRAAKEQSEQDRVADEWMEELTELMDNHLYGDPENYSQNWNRKLKADELLQKVEQAADASKLTSERIRDVAMTIQFVTGKTHRSDKVSGLYGAVDDYTKGRPGRVGSSYNVRTYRKKRAELTARVVARRALVHANKHRKEGEPEIELTKKKVDELAKRLSKGAGLTTGGFFARRGVGSLSDFVVQGWYMSGENMSKYKIYSPSRRKVTNLDAKARPQPIWEHPIIQDLVKNPEMTTWQARREFDRQVWSGETIVGQKRIRSAFRKGVAKGVVDRALTDIGALDVSGYAHPMHLTHSRYANVAKGGKHVTGFNSHVGYGSFTRTKLPAAFGMGGRRRKQFFEVSRPLEQAVRNGLYEAMEHLTNKEMDDLKSDIPALVENAMYVAAKDPKVPFTLAGRNQNKSGNAERILRRVKIYLPMSEAQARRDLEYKGERELTDDKIQRHMKEQNQNRAKKREELKKQVLKDRARLVKYSEKAQDFPVALLKRIVENNHSFAELDFTSTVRADLAQHMMFELQDANPKDDELEEFIQKRVARYAEHMPTMLGLKKGVEVTAARVNGRAGIDKMAKIAMGKNADKEAEQVVVTPYAAGLVVSKALEECKFGLDYRLKKRLTEQVAAQIRKATDAGKTLDAEELARALKDELEIELYDVRTERRAGKDVVTFHSVYHQISEERDFTKKHKTVKPNYLVDLARNFVKPSQAMARVASVLDGEIERQLGGFHEEAFLNGVMSQIELSYGEIAAHYHFKVPMSGTLQEAIREELAKGVRENPDLKFDTDTMEQMADATMVVLSFADMEHSDKRTKNPFRKEANKFRLNRTALGYDDSDRPLEFQTFTSAMNLIGRGDYVNALEKYQEKGRWFLTAQERGTAMERSTQEQGVPAMVKAAGIMLTAVEGNKHKQKVEEERADRKRRGEARRVDQAQREETARVAAASAVLSGSQPVPGASAEEGLTDGIGVEELAGDTRAASLPSGVAGEARDAGQNLRRNRFTLGGAARVAKDIIKRGWRANKDRKNRGSSGRGAGKS